MAGKACFLVFILFATSCSRSSEGILPEQKNITEAVYASATVQADSLYKIYAAAGGIVEAVMVKEGDTVDKGQPLLQIRNQSPKLNQANAQLAYDLARKNLSGSDAILSRLQDEIHAARLRYHNDSLIFFRQKRLWEQRVGSQAQFEQAQLAYDLSSNQLRVLENNYSLTRTRLQTELLQASNNLAQARLLTGDFLVESAINGLVYTLTIEPGEQVMPQQPLGTIGSTSRFVLELLVDEEDITRVRKGMRVLVTLDAFSKEVFEAKIHRIYPSKNERNQTFLIEALFTNPPSPLYPGLSGEANIIVAQKAMALCVPSEYVSDAGEVRTSNGLLRVQTGLRDMRFTEIISGIDSNTRLYSLEP